MTAQSVGCRLPELIAGSLHLCFLAYAVFAPLARLLRWRETLRPELTRSMLLLKKVLQVGQLFCHSPLDPAASSDAQPPLCHSKCSPHSALHTEEVPKKSNWRTFCWISKVKGLNEKSCESHSCSKGDWQMVWLVARGRRITGREGRTPLYSAQWPQWAQLYHVTAPPGWGSTAGWTRPALAQWFTGSVWRNAGLMNTRAGKSEWDGAVQQRKEESGTVQPAVRSA